MDALLTLLIDAQMVPVKLFKDLQLPKKVVHLLLIVQNSHHTNVQMDLVLVILAFAKFYQIVLTMNGDVLTFLALKRRQMTEQRIVLKKYYAQL